MNNKQITIVFVAFEGIAKGKRKTDRQLIELGTLDGHTKLDENALNVFKDIARGLIKERGYKIGATTRLILKTNFGTLDGPIRSVQLLPVQQSLFTMGF